MQSGNESRKTDCSKAQGLALGLVLLSVFAWGLQYKLSLYRTEKPTHATMPSAKLLSPRERIIPSSSALTSPFDPASQHLLVGSACVFLFVLSLPRKSARIATQSMASQIYLLHTKPFPRPPPRAL